MKKIILSLVVFSMFLSTTASADVAKGQKLFTKKLKSACGVSGAAMASKHTTDQWIELNEAGKISDEIKIICPKVTQKALKEKYIPHYFDFFKEYASDTGNVPSC